MSDDTSRFNIPIANISGSDIKVGDNRVYNTVTNVSTTEIIRDIAKDLPPEEKKVVEDTILAPLQEIAALSPEEQQTPEVQAQTESLLSRLTPYAPIVAKGLATVGKAALTTLASGSPVFAGIVALCDLIDTKVA